MKNHKMEYLRFVWGFRDPSSASFDSVNQMWWERILWVWNIVWENESNHIYHRCKNHLWHRHTHILTHTKPTLTHSCVCVCTYVHIMYGLQFNECISSSRITKIRQKNQTVVHEIIAVHREENTNKSQIEVCVCVCVRVNLPIHVWSELNRLLSFLVFGLHLLLAFSLHLLLLLCIFMLCFINLVQNAHCKTFVSQNSRNYFHLMSEIPSHSNWVHINFKTIFLLLSLVFVLYLLYGFWFPNPLTLVFFFFYFNNNNHRENCSLLLKTLSHAHARKHSTQTVTRILLRTICIKCFFRLFILFFFVVDSNLIGVTQHTYMMVVVQMKRLHKFSIIEKRITYLQIPHTHSLTLIGIVLFAFP